MARFRTRTEIYRADTRDLVKLAIWQGFAEVDQTQDLQLVLPTSGSTVTLDPASYGMTRFEEVYLESEQEITVTLEATTTAALQVEQLLVLRGTDLASITLFSAWSIETKVHVILGGS